MFKDKLEDGDDVGDDVAGRSRNDDNHPSPPLSYIPPQSTTSYTKTVVGVTKTVKQTGEIQEGKGRMVTQERREGGER
jgi:hypothetical protein